MGKRRAILLLSVGLLLHGCFGAHVNWSRTDGDDSPAAPSETPALERISPNRGAHGLTVTITGMSFAEGAEVQIGGVDCTDVAVTSSTTLTCSVGSHATAVAEVSVRNPESGTTILPGAFTYLNFLYVGHTEAEGIGVFQVAENGDLTLISGSPFGSTPQLTDLKITPNGKFLYTTSLSTSRIYQFRIDNQTGGLEEVGTPPINSAPPRSIAISANGKFLYTANGSSETVSGYAIGSDGQLQQVASSPFAGSGLIPSLAFGATNKFLFAGEVQVAALTVKTFLFNSTAGGLTALNSAGQSGGETRGGCAHPQKNFVFAIGFDSMAGWTFDEEGTLTPAGSPISTGEGFTCLCDPSGKFLLASRTASSAITSYAIAPDGALTLIDHESAPSHPQGMAFHLNATIFYGALSSSHKIGIYTLDLEAGTLSLDVHLINTLNTPTALAVN